MSSSEHPNQNAPKNPLHGDFARHGNVDRRALRTRQALHQALIQLIVERDYDEISVMDIAEAANVGRSTFYAHFTDKDDLLRSGTVHFRDMLLKDHATRHKSDGPDGQLLSFSRFMTEHLNERKDLYRALKRGRAGPIIMEAFRLYVCELVRADLSARAAKAGHPHDTELAVQFIVGAFMSVLSWWMDRGAKEDPADIDRAFTALASDGFLRLFPGNASGHV
jgi:AcrR family transcriptional regulator